MNHLIDRLPAGAFRQIDAARAGISSRTLYRLRDSGQLEIIGRGLYRRAGDTPADLDLLEITRRAPRATIALATALARHGLTDAIPGRIDIAIPRGGTAPTTSAPVAWHHFAPASFDLGRELITIEGTEDTIGLYSAERSIADAFRLRGTQGYELPIEALRAWLAQRGNHPATLIEIARQIPRAETSIRDALAYLT